MKSMIIGVLSMTALCVSAAIAHAVLFGPNTTGGSAAGIATPRNMKDLYMKHERATINNEADKAQPQGPVYSKAAHDITPLSKERIEELAKKLTPEERRVILASGTEPAFCGNLVDNKKQGTYICRLCSLPLFESKAKFDSGTGWPSFFSPVDTAHIVGLRDTSHGMVRVEILCARCSGHHGHVFDDAPRTPTGLRFCVNSASLEFIEDGQKMPDAALPVATETAYFAAGCFWGVEDRLQRFPGVIDAVSGYMGGKTKEPTYEQICRGDTDHAETVKVVFDPKRTNYDQLLGFFFRLHDPTQLNRQGPDVGTQYRSHIFTVGETQKAAAEKFIKEQQGNPRFKGRPVVTRVSPAGGDVKFYAAEEYHQDYHIKNGGHCAMPEP
ncbi:MAG: bifunctional methionine sulfoxide reductase B/A protein [Phycisphaerales bacterium]